VDNGAGFPGAEFGDEELRAVRQQKRDAVAFADPSDSSAAANAVLSESSSP
jgi:hypothetical protein